jgi:hypothetical protein
MKQQLNDSEKYRDVEKRKDVRDKRYVFLVIFPIGHV